MIILIIIIYLSINGGLISKFNDLTKHTNNNEMSSMPIWFIGTFALFGVFMFLFIEQFRNYRKDYYLKRSIETYDNLVIEHKMHPSTLKNFFSDDCYFIPDEETYKHVKRYLKIKKLSKKSKRHGFFRRNNN